jgi:hypothetical protein
MTEKDKACVAYLLGRLTAHAEAMADDPGGDANDRHLNDLVALRKLLLPETGRPREPDPDAADPGPFKRD